VTPPLGARGPALAAREEEEEMEVEEEQNLEGKNMFP